MDFSLLDCVCIPCSAVNCIEVFNTNHVELPSGANLPKCQHRARILPQEYNFDPVFYEYSSTR